MEFQGKIIEVLPVRSGVSKNSGSEWKVQQYVIESHGEYPRKMCFEVFGADRISQFNIQPGEELTVSFDIESREYQGRWYTNINAWKVTRQTETAAPVPPVTADDPFAAPAAPVATDFPPASSTDDLPF